MKYFRGLRLSLPLYACIILLPVFAASVAAQTAQDSQGTGAGTDL